MGTTEIGIKGTDIGKKLCDYFGVNPDMCREITIKIDYNSTKFFFEMIDVADNTDTIINI